MPLTVAVLDAGGNLIALKREDGSGILRVDIAVGKAWASLGMGMPSRAIRDRLKDRPAFQGALAAASRPRGAPPRPKRPHRTGMPRDCDPGF